MGLNLVAVVGEEHEVGGVVEKACQILGELQVQCVLSGQSRKRERAQNYGQALNRGLDLEN